MAHACGRGRHALVVSFVHRATEDTVLLEWKAGGDSIVWVWLELPHYLVHPLTTDVAFSLVVHMASFEEGLGIMIFVAGAVTTVQVLDMSCTHVCVPCVSVCDSNTELSV